MIAITHVKFWNVHQGVDPYRWLLEAENDGKMLTPPLRYRLLDEAVGYAAKLVKRHPGLEIRLVLNHPSLDAEVPSEEERLRTLAAIIKPPA